jgi:hypothetical protein
MRALRRLATAGVQPHSGERTSHSEYHHHRCQQDRQPFFCLPLVAAPNFRESPECELRLTGFLGSLMAPKSAELPRLRPARRQLYT